MITILSDETIQVTNNGSFHHNSVNFLELCSRAENLNRLDKPELIKLMGLRGVVPLFGAIGQQIAEVKAGPGTSGLSIGKIRKALVKEDTIDIWLKYFL